MTGFLKNNIARVQLLLVVLVWLLLFTVPVLFGESAEQINWHHVIRIWKEYSVLLIIFLLNRFVLMPYLFLRGKRRTYFLAIVGLIIAFSALIFILHQAGKSHPPAGFQLSQADIVQQGNGPPHRPGPRGFIPPFANLIIMSVLLIGFDSGLIFFSKWVISEKDKIKLEKESIATEMAFLKNQISPHFFMNTLNNIHSLVDIDTEEAKHSIIRLSQMMDYLLYESESSHIPLEQELKFIRSYAELMKLRLTDEVDFILDIPEELPPISIPPLLTISFIENAFKYGISYERKSFIHIHYRLTKNILVFEVTNSLHSDKQQAGKQGIGIENARKRLELIYGVHYELFIQEKNDVFEVNLNIPI